MDRQRTRGQYFHFSIHDVTLVGFILCEMKRQTDLRVIPVGHVQDFQDHVCLVHKPIISHFLSDPLKDLGERPLTQTLHLKGEIGLITVTKYTNIGSSWVKIVK